MLHNSHTFFILTASLHHFLQSIQLCGRGIGGIEVHLNMSKCAKFQRFIYIEINVLISFFDINIIEYFTSNIPFLSLLHGVDRVNKEM